jgi:hypothetical protein
MINSDQIHVAMTKMRGRVATPVCQSNILLKQGTVKGEREREETSRVLIVSAVYVFTGWIMWSTIVSGSVMRLSDSERRVGCEARVHTLCLCLCLSL